jgi:aspartyl-tRNA synthetase
MWAGIGFPLPLTPKQRLQFFRFGHTNSRFGGFHLAGDLNVAIAYNRRTHKNGELRSSDVGREVILVGWAQNYRDLGGMAFIDIRDFTGVTQVKFNPQTDPVAHKLAGTVRREDVIAVRGNVAPRGENVNPKLPTGEIEVEGHELDVLSKSETPPFEVDDSVDATEDARLRYRVVDLRRPKMQATLRLRHRLARAAREYFDQQGFIEIETPMLGKSTPEGARDYLVPSRVYPGKFYALPQSPQLYKQIFMMAGFDRYCQIVRCFRDEDLRADRQPEFTQVDIEMAFVQVEDVLAVVEGAVQRMFKEGIGLDIKTPFPRMSYKEAMDRYGIDRPDLRFGLELKDITAIAGKTDFSIFQNAIAAGGVVKCIVAKGGGNLTRKVTDDLTDELKGVGGGGLPLTKVIAGAGGTPELSTGIAKFLQPVCGELLAATGAEVGDAIFCMPGSYADVSKHLHFVRTRLAEIQDLIPDDQWNLLWVVDFPMFEYDAEEKRYVSLHHPFTAPRDEDVHMLDTEPGKVTAKAYDLTLNGIEMAGGSIRIHQGAIQSKVFNLLGISDEEAHEKFQFLMDALRFGAPPHGGIAMGLDRWVMMLGKCASLRDVIAFPKTQRAVCPLTNAPGEVDEKQLIELGVDKRPEVKAKEAKANEARASR